MSASHGARPPRSAPASPPAADLASGATGAPRLRASELDAALAFWTPTALPEGFAARTMARVRAQPRFRLSGTDALVAAAGAVVAGAACAAAAGLSAPDGVVWRQAMLTASRVLLAIRPADPRVGWSLLGAVLLAGLAVGLAAWVGQAPRTWRAVNR